MRKIPIIYVFVLACIMACTAAARGVYSPPLDDKPVDLAKVELTDEERGKIATALAGVARNGNTSNQEHLNFCSRALAVALMLDPENKSAVVADMQLREGRQPKRGRKVPATKFATYLVGAAGKATKAEGDDNVRLAGYLLSLAQELDPNNDDVEYALAMRKKNGQAHDWTALVDAAAGEAADDGQRITASNPEFAEKERTFQKKLGRVNGLFVMTNEAGLQAGQASEIYAAIQPHHRPDEFRYGFIRGGIGQEMATSMHEAMRTVNVRYPHVPGGTHLQLSFADKYSQKDGGSAGTAFAILILSLLDDFEIDEAFAVTGDITIDWTTRQVGAIPSKVRGARLDGCKYVIVPAENFTQVNEIPLLYSIKTIWRTQIFGPPTLEEAVDIVRTDRDPNLQEAIDRFAKVQAYLEKHPSAYKDNPKILSALRRVVQLAPSHFSARYLINAAAKKTPRHLTASTSFEETFLAAQEFIPFVQIPYSPDRYDVPEDTYKNARTRLANLEPVVHQKCVGLTREFHKFISTMRKLDRDADRNEARTERRGIKAPPSRQHTMSPEKSSDTATRLYEDLAEHQKALRDMLNKLSYDRKLMDTILRD